MEGGVAFAGAGGAAEDDESASVGRGIDAVGEFGVLVAGDVCGKGVRVDAG